MASFDDTFQQSTPTTRESLRRVEGYDPISLAVQERIVFLGWNRFSILDLNASYRWNLAVCDDGDGRVEMSFRIVVAVVDLIPELYRRILNQAKFREETRSKVKHTSREALRVPSKYFLTISSLCICSSIKAGSSSPSMLSIAS